METVIAAVITLGMICSATVGWCSLITSAYVDVTYFSIVATWCLPFSNSARSINLSAIVNIAESFGISNGMQPSRSTHQRSNSMMGLFASFETVIISSHHSHVASPSSHYGSHAVCSRHVFILFFRRL